MKELINKFHERKKLSGEFYKIFKVSLSSYLDPMTGFDIVKFDDYLIKHGEDYMNNRISMKSFIRKKYGKEGVELIKKLIQGE